MFKSAYQPITDQNQQITRPDGGIGRHAGLKILWPVMAVRVQFPLRVHLKQDRN